MIKYIAITGKGEPLLHPNFYSFCTYIDFWHIPFGVTTNGDYLDEDLIKELLKLKYLKGIRVSVYEVSNASYWKSMAAIYLKISIYNQTGVEIPELESGYKVVYKGTEKYASMQKDFNTIKSCKAPFSFLTINTDGSVVPCYSYHEIGNIKDGFLKLYNGRKIRKYRRDALKMKTTMSDCKNCGIKINQFL